MSKARNRPRTPPPARPRPQARRTASDELRRAIRRTRHAMDLARVQGDYQRELVHLCELDTLRAKLAKLDPEGREVTTLAPSPAPEGATCTYVRPPAPDEAPAKPRPEKRRIAPNRRDPRKLAARADRHRRSKQGSGGSRSDGGDGA
jgi:hypothetical protein